MIPVYQPNLKGNEKKYVTECLNSSWISSKGKFIDKFENSFAKFVGSKYACSSNNGTTALHLALLVLGIGPKDEVIIPSFTYVATANAVNYTGAKIVLADVHSDYWNINPDLIEKKITKRTKAIIAVHLYGHPCNMDPIKRIAKKYNLYVIEDAAEAHGALYKGKMVGNLGDIAAFSFYGNKVITTGEGGMITTSSKILADKVNHLKGQGVSRTKTYWHDVIGYNYRMTNIQAAIGLAQLEKINEIIQKKRKLADMYKKFLKDISQIKTQDEEPWAKSVYWMFSIIVSKNKRDKLRNYLYKKGIETRPFFYPVHQLPMYKQKSFYPVSDSVGAQGINLPSYPELTVDQVKKITKEIKNFFQNENKKN